MRQCWFTQNAGANACDNFEEASDEHRNAKRNEPASKSIRITLAPSR